MSVPTRRIGYYFMDFTELDTDERTFDKDLFKRLLVYINGLGGKDRVIKDTSLLFFNYNNQYWNSSGNISVCVYFYDFKYFAFNI